MRHKKSRHATDEDRMKLKCPYYGEQPIGCLMTFPNRDQLRKHIKRKHEKHIQCDKCINELELLLEDGLIAQEIFDMRVQSEFTFNKKNQLKNHMMSIHGEGWFICEEHCGKKFSSIKLLDSHMQRIDNN